MPANLEPLDIFAVLGDTNPLRSGYIHIKNGELWHRGAEGRYWPATGRTANVAYFMYVSGAVSPSHTVDNYRYMAYALRCLSTDGEGSVIT